VSQLFDDIQGENLLVKEKHSFFGILGKEKTLNVVCLFKAQGQTHLRKTDPYMMTVFRQTPGRA
jgi:hypothetical protein